MKITTLCFLDRDSEILLAMKKRGFGAGRWNGVGGKLTEGETVEQAAVREIFEEIGVKVSASELKKVAMLNFTFPHKPEWNQISHVFFISNWEGEPSESEEMNPKWHRKEELPFHSMWSDDPHWLPRVIKGERVHGHFTFDENSNVQGEYRVELLAE